MSATPVKGSAPVVPVPVTAEGIPSADVGMHVASSHTFATSVGTQSSSQVVPSPSVVVVVGGTVVVVVTGVSVVVVVVVGVAVVVAVVVGGVSVVVVVVAGGGVSVVVVVVVVGGVDVDVLDDESAANADGAQITHSASVTNTGRSRFTVVPSSSFPGSWSRRKGLLLVPRSPHRLPSFGSERASVATVAWAWNHRRRGSAAKYIRLRARGKKKRGPHSELCGPRRK